MSRVVKIPIPEKEDEIQGNINSRRDHQKDIGSNLEMVDAINQGHDIEKKI